MKEAEIYELIKSGKSLKKIKKSLTDEQNVTKKIAILSGSTIGTISDIWEIFLLSYGIQPQFWIGDYKRFYEDAVYENESLQAFQPDYIYIHTSNRNIREFPSFKSKKDDVDCLLQLELERFQQVWDSLSDHYHCAIIQNNFEYSPYRIVGNADGTLQNGRIRFINKLNEMFADYADQTSNFYLNDINYLSAYYGLEKWTNLSQWYLYQYALDVEAIPLLCRSLTHIIKSTLGKNKKAIITDLDNTLWGGVIGDDGVEGIELGEESALGRCYNEFQGYLKALSEIGVLLNVCSKNEEKNAEDGFRHQASKLKREDFVVFQANWREKHENVKEIIDAVNLMEDSFVFLDDNPMERELVKSNYPDMAVPELSLPEGYIKLLDQSGYFEITTLSQDDLQRKDFYAANATRQKEIKKYATYQEYLQSLAMRASIQAFDSQTLERVTQLINKTNQFNLTTKRYIQAEVAAVMANEKYLTLKGQLSDKFGDNGIVTALIAEIDRQSAIIELWIMSCRVFKRDMEYALFDALINECKLKKINTLIGIYKPTKKNNLVKDWYETLGFIKKKEDATETIFEYTIPETYQQKNRVIEVK